MILVVTPVAAIGTSGVIVQGISHFWVGIAIYMMKISMMGPETKLFNPYQSVRYWLMKKKRRRGRLYTDFKEREAKMAKLSC